LISKEQKPAFVQQVRTEYDRIRAQHAGQQVKLLTLEQARANAPTLGYDDLPRPEFIGVRVTRTVARPEARAAFDEFPLEELEPFIDWSPFFHTWELRGRYPSILKHPKHGEEAGKLFADARHLLEQIQRDNLLRACGVYGFFPPIQLKTLKFTRRFALKVLAVFHFLRQQMAGGSNAQLVVGRFHRAKSSGKPDYIGAFAVRPDWA
jgi:5-methyltetrahydrofolate--homocysteine methyltransferase